MSKPRLIIETEITQYGKRRPTVLRLDLATCRQAMAELARAERILLAAAAAGEPAQDEAAGPRNQGPACACGHQLGARFASGLCAAPAPAGAGEPHRTVAAGPGQPAVEVPAEAGEEDPADRPAPHHAGPGEPRCEAYDDDNGEGWLCTAQAGHGGPVHLAYAENGAVARMWPCGQHPLDPATFAGDGVLGRLLAAGHRVTFAEDLAWPGSWYADLRDAQGRCVETGGGATQAAALAGLRERCEHSEPAAAALAAAGALR